MARVSICIPTYNNTEIFVRLMDSIKIQTYSDYEIVISDDSNSNEIENIIMDKYRDMPITYIHNVVKLGPTKNTNNAIINSKGDLIKIMHHDDYFTDEDSLCKMVDLLDEQKNIDFAFCGTIEDYRVKVQRCIKWWQRLLLKNSKYNLLIGNYIGAPSATLYKRNKNVLMDEKLKWLVDIDLYLRILDGKNYSYTTEPLVTIGHSESQLTNECVEDKKLNEAEYNYLFEKYNVSKKIIGRLKMIFDRN